MQPKHHNIRPIFLIGYRYQICASPDDAEKVMFIITKSFKGINDMIYVR